jgi:hypothetical protein
MTTNKEMERIVRSWLEPGLTTLTDDVLDPVLDQLPATPQRRPWWPARRIADMSAFAKFAIAAAAVMVVAVVGYNLLGAAGSGQVGSSPSPSAEPSSSLPPLAPWTGEAIDPGRYRWTSPVADVSFTLPDGYSGRDGLMQKNEDTPTAVGFRGNLPGTGYEVNSVYSDACSGEPEPIGDSVDDLVAALESQGSSDVVVGDVAAGSVAGKRIEISETPGLDRSQCTYGIDGPHQIWVEVSGNGYLAFGGDSRAVVYIFDVDGNRLVFWGAFAPETTEADVEEIDAIVQSFEFTPH